MFGSVTLRKIFIVKVGTVTPAVERSFVDAQPEIRKEIEKQQLEKLSRKYVSGEQITMAQLFLQKGCLVPQHSHMSEQVSFIVTGCLKFLIEGEEEISSPNLAPFIREHADLLRCDNILISDTGMYEDGWPTITYGTRGLLYKEIRLTGPAHDLHSGSFGGSIANPANVLAEIIAGLHDADGRVTIPGFYYDVADASPAERAQLSRLPFDERQYLADVGSPAACGERGYSTNERRWIRPTLDVNGIYGGFIAEGANTVIPARAGAKVSMRLVPNQSGAKLSGRFDETVRARCPATVRLEILNHGHADAYVAPLDSVPMRAASKALHESFGREPAFIREGGSLPILPTFKRLLGADSLLLGFASPNCNAHGPNEKACLADLDRGAEAVARLLAYLAE